MNTLGLKPGPVRVGGMDAVVTDVSVKFGMEGRRTYDITIVAYADIDIARLFSSPAVKKAIADEIKSSGERIIKLDE